MDYLDLVPESGRWYVSEGFRVGNRLVMNDEDVAAMTDHHQGAHRMILAGPFNTRSDAELELPKFQTRHQPFVWRKV